jgi:hypothetical protein
LCTGNVSSRWSPFSCHLLVGDSGSSDILTFLSYGLIICHIWVVVNSCPGHPSGHPLIFSALHSWQRSPPQPDSPPAVILPPLVAMRRAPQAQLASLLRCGRMVAAGVVYAIGC